MRLQRFIPAVIALTSSLAGTATAHHSNAMFDQAREVTVTGVVREFQWTNPHVFIELTVDGPNGPSNFTIETGNPGMLRSHGWKFNSLQAGDKVVAKIHPLRNGNVGGALISLSKDGKVIGDGRGEPGYGSSAEGGAK